MNDVMTPHGVDSEKVLQIAIDERVPAIMSYLSKDKWHVAKVLLTDLTTDHVKVESTSSVSIKRPINIQVNQPVGISFKYGYGKFIFDTVVRDLEPSSGPDAPRGQGGTIVLAMPNKIDAIQRRSYFRVNAPESLNVQVLLWHRSGNLKENHHLHEPADEMKDCCQGSLVDISAGGTQIAVPREGKTQGADFRKGQFVGVRFTPGPYETPIVFSAQIRSILPTADGKSASMGLQIVGLEASPEGREVLARLIGVVDQYFTMNKAGAKRQDAQPVVNRA